MKTKFILLALLFMNCIELYAQSIMNIHQSNGTVLQIPLNTIDSITFTNPNPGNLATLTTLSVSNISNNSATSGGNISNNGGSPVTQRGVVWSTTPNPTTANNSSNNGGGTGSFNSILTGLIANTTYFVRAYATNSAGTAYGNELSFTTTSGGVIVSNPGAGVTFDGYTYTSVVLGNGQEWMAENLRTSIYANGDPIPNVIDATQWFNLSTGAWVCYNNDNQFENPFGKLYNWYTVIDPRNVCPTGWHVPSDSELSNLFNYLDPNSNGGNYALNSAGGKLKITGTQYWQSPNQDATNETGFSGLPGGYRNGNGPFDYYGGFGFHWSISDANISHAWAFRLDYASGSAVWHSGPKLSGFSIRCIKD